MTTLIPKGFAPALLSVLLASSAQLLMKGGIAALPPMADPLTFVPALWHVWPATLAVATGLFFYVASMLSWYFALKSLPLSIAYPLISLSYVIVWLAAIALPAFRDTFSLGKAGAMVMILAGIYLVCGKPRGG
ncbi:4-amino-4-deoxy-L-arabinose-phosphoundecaprenol flippase subunit ArnF [Pleomorphomonas oryzae]|uniref:4-amino-4-deoxy-L-arabinose-phosphoundecaprenol flippase subunit ArnF n=1 Tax=Pleomorphomonas oryzae TaxID=261934 RepID=UPI00042591B8|nr:4-amino-4-deoxy-L-arabinose-phosphoundecaprenol flippase subunit ArnF [Pleomorphomonas oryzae]